MSARMSSVLAACQPRITAVKRRLFGIPRTIYVARCGCGKFRAERTSPESASHALAEHRREVAA